RLASRNADWKPQPPLPGHQGGVVSVASWQDKWGHTRVVTASEDHIARVWTPERGHAFVTETLTLPHDDARYKFDSVDLALRGRQVALRDETRILLWHVDDCPNESREVPTPREHPPLAISFAPDGSALVAIAARKVLRWPLPLDTHRQPSPVSLGSVDSAAALKAVFSSDGTQFATWDTQRQIRVWPIAETN